MLKSPSFFKTHGSYEYILFSVWIHMITDMNILVNNYEHSEQIKFILNNNKLPTPYTSSSSFENVKYWYECSYLKWIVFIYNQWDIHIWLLKCSYLIMKYKNLSKIKYITENKKIEQKIVKRDIWE
jgi:hypothetical protein